MTAPRRSPNRSLALALAAALLGLIACASATGPSPAPAAPVSPAAPASPDAPLSPRSPHSNDTTGPPAGAAVLERAESGPEAPAPALLRRVAVLGASGSNGFGIKAEIGVPIRLAEVVDAAIRGAHEPPLDASNAFFFLDPDGHAERLLERALEHEPSLVIAPDFLFWFGYGILPESARPRRLERGLALLDRFDCALLVGDLPYMPQAVGGMLLASQLPEQATVESMNARIRAWCDERPRATFVPVADFAEQLTRGEAVELEGVRLGGDGRAEVLQPDRLHPTLLGAAGLVALALDRLAQAGDAVPREALLLDPERIAELVLAAKAPELRALEERRATARPAATRGSSRRPR